MVKQIFINLAVKNLERSVEFFAALGFSFNPDFTDEKATCMIMGENIFAMLLTEEFFDTFIPTTERVDSLRMTEVLTAITLESREAVDKMVDVALSLGATEPRPPQDYGWMYSRSFQDLDGHIWEPFYGDEEVRQQQGDE